MQRFEFDAGICRPGGPTVR